MIPEKNTPHAQKSQCLLSFSYKKTPSQPQF